MSADNADGKEMTRFFCPLFNFRLATAEEEEKAGVTIIDGEKEEESFARIKFIGNTTIGGLRKKDLTQRQLLDWEFDRHIATAFYDKHGYIPVIEICDTIEKNIVRLVENIVLALRLFKEGDVFCKILWSEGDTGFSVLTSTYELPNTIFKESYRLKAEEISAVNEIFEKVNKTDLSKRRPLRIAFDRLNRSYGKSMLDEKIVDFMIAFEALFLRDNTPNHGLVIGTACSLLLGKSDEEREEIYNFFIEAYTLRNKIVHGSQIDFTGINDIVLKLKGYLRKAILLLI